eukprot:8817209-Pyramimonas_sp.AAC.1
MSASASAEKGSTDSSKVVPAVTKIENQGVPYLAEQGRWGGRPKGLNTRVRVKNTIFKRSRCVVHRMNRGDALGPPF